MMTNKFRIIHAIKLIAGKNQIMIDIPLLKQPLVLAYSIGSTLKPAWTIGGLLSS